MISGISSVDRRCEDHSVQGGRKEEGEDVVLKKLGELDF